MEHSRCDSGVSSEPGEFELVAAVDSAAEDMVVGAPAVFAEIADVAILGTVCCSSSVIDFVESVVGFAESVVDFAELVVVELAGVADVISLSLGWLSWCPLPQTSCLSPGNGLAPLGFCPPRDGAGLKKKTIAVVSVVAIAVGLA